MEDNFSPIDDEEFFLGKILVFLMIGGVLKRLGGGIYKSEYIPVLKPGNDDGGP